MQPVCCCDRGSRQANGIRTFRSHNEAKPLKAWAKACRVKWPTLKLRRQIGVRRAICRNVRSPNPRPASRMPAAVGLFAVPKKWWRRFRDESTGAGTRIRTFSPSLGVRIRRCASSLRARMTARGCVAASRSAASIRSVEAITDAQQPRALPVKELAALVANVSKPIYRSNTHSLEH
jgi:hypothetical protein